MTSVTAAPTVGGNAAASASLARCDCGSFVGLPSVVSAPPSSRPDRDDGEHDQHDPRSDRAPRMPGACQCDSLQPHPTRLDSTRCPAPRTFDT